MNFGKLLRKTRKQAELTQEELADILFLNTSTISKLESDSASLSLTRGIQWFDAVNRRDIIFFFTSGIQPDDVMKIAFRYDYLGEMDKIEAFKILNGSTFNEVDLEQYVFATTHELKQWREYLLKRVKSVSQC